VFHAHLPGAGVCWVCRQMASRILAPIAVQPVLMQDSTFFLFWPWASNGIGKTSVQGGIFEVPSRWLNLMVLGSAMTHLSAALALHLAAFESAQQERNLNHSIYLHKDLHQQQN
jgi:hypothetical protein